MPLRLNISRFEKHGARGSLYAARLWRGLHFFAAGLAEPCPALLLSYSLRRRAARLGARVCRVRVPDHVRLEVNPAPRGPPGSSNEPSKRTAR